MATKVTLRRSARLKLARPERRGSSTLKKTYRLAISFHRIHGPAKSAQVRLSAQLTACRRDDSENHAASGAAVSIVLEVIRLQPLVYEPPKRLVCRVVKRYPRSCRRSRFEGLAGE